MITIIPYGNKQKQTYTMYKSLTNSQSMYASIRSIVFALSVANEKHFWSFSKHQYKSRYMYMIYRENNVQNVHQFNFIQRVLTFYNIETNILKHLINT